MKTDRRRRPVKIGDRVYPSREDAAIEHGVDPRTILNWIADGKAEAIPETGKAEVPEMHDDELPETLDRDDGPPGRRERLEPQPATQPRTSLPEAPDHPARHQQPAITQLSTPSDPRFAGLLAAQRDALRHGGPGQWTWLDTFWLIFRLVAIVAGFLLMLELAT